MPCYQFELPLQVLLLGQMLTVAEAAWAWARKVQVHMLLSVLTVAESAWAWALQVQLQMLLSQKGQVIQRIEIQLLLLVPVLMLAEAGCTGALQVQLEVLLLHVIQRIVWALQSWDGDILRKVDCCQVPQELQGLREVQDMKAILASP